MPDIDTYAFIKACQTEFKGPASIKDTAALGILLNFISNDPTMTDPRQIAYLLATVKLETKHTMRPIPEGGPAKYFNRYEPGTTSGKNVGNTHVGDGTKYKGRGYAQLTGHDNYKKFGTILNLPLVDCPDLALNPTVSYRIISMGMVRGLFRSDHHHHHYTGYSLGMYINSNKCDYFNARNIINGKHDCAKEIEGYAYKFEHAFFNVPQLLRPYTSTPAQNIHDKKNKLPLLQNGDSSCSIE